jgi:hypothetical protein
MKQTRITKQAARELSMDVVPEGGMMFYWNLNQIVDGHTTIEHSLPMAPLYKDVVTLFAQSGTAWTPTLIVNYGGIWGEEYWYQATNVWEDPRLMRFVPNAPVMARSLRREKAQAPWDYHHFSTAKSVAAVFNAGGLVQTGAHGQQQVPPPLPVIVPRMVLSDVCGVCACGACRVLASIGRC